MISISTDDLIRKLPDPLPKRILLQLPEGLQPQARILAQTIEEKSNNQTTVYVSGDPCYGACDLADDQAQKISADLIIHLGHTPFGVQSRIPVIYYPVKVSLNTTQLITAIQSELPIQHPLGLATTAQHLHQLSEIQQQLNAHQYTSLIGTGKGTISAGQVLGCNYSTCTEIASQVDVFLYIGTGLFHPLGIAYSTGKPVYAFNPNTHVLRALSDEYQRHRSLRLAAITEAKDAGVFGIIISSKPGQFHINKAEQIRDILHENEKSSIIMIFRDIRKDQILNFPDIDAFVVTACPRVAIDDQAQYTRPVLTPEELEVVLGQRGFNDVYPVTEET